MGNGNGQQSPPPNVVAAHPISTTANESASQTPSKSPLPPQPADKTMSFSEAIEEVRRGKKVTKIEWGNKAIYGFLHEAKLRWTDAQGKLHDWIISEGDIIGNDWIVV